MTTSSIRDDAGRRDAFTLVELLMVILLLTILFGLSLTSIRAVSRHIHRTATHAELKSIEMAWKQYYAHYQSWPTNGTMGVFEPSCLDGDLASVLQGTEETGTWMLNPDKIVFMEFSRLTRGNIPLNAWGLSDRFYDRKRMKSDERKGSWHPCFYFVAFDGDDDHFIEFPSVETLGEGETAPSDKDSKEWKALEPFKDNGNKIDRDVIVWTFDPELQTDSPDYLIGSWQ